MNLIYYGRGPASSAPRQSSQNPKRRRFSTEAWDSIRDQVNREHRVLAAADPRSPRIKPTLWSVR